MAAYASTRNLVSTQTSTQIAVKFYKSKYLNVIRLFRPGTVGITAGNNCNSMDNKARSPPPCMAASSATTRFLKSRLCTAPHRQAKTVSQDYLTILPSTIAQNGDFGTAPQKTPELVFRHEIGGRGSTYGHLPTVAF